MSSQPTSRAESASTAPEHGLIETQLLAAPHPGDASRDRHEQLVYAHLSDAAGQHWFVCELDHDAGRAGVWEWPVGDGRRPGWREVSLQDLASRTGSKQVSLDRGWQRQSTADCGVDAYSIGMDRIDRVAAKLAHAAGRG